MAAKASAQIAAIDIYHHLTGSSMSGTLQSYDMKSHCGEEEDYLLELGLTHSLREIEDARGRMTWY